MRSKFWQFGIWLHITPFLGAFVGTSTSIMYMTMTNAMSEFPAIPITGLSLSVVLIAAWLFAWKGTLKFRKV